MAKKNKFIISGGGTGGHIYPAISIAKEIGKNFKDCELKFIGAKGRMEMSIVPKYGYEIQGLLISGLHRSFTLKNIFLPFKLFISFIQSLLIIITFKPNFVIGTGGFASFPIVFISSILRIPTLIQEQNSIPGISNRLLSRSANYICVAYDKMDKFFPAKKIFKTGNPIMESIKNINNTNDIKQKLNFEEGKTVILILGGSLGSEKINRTVEKNIDYIISKDVNVIWQCGKKYFNDFKHFKSKSIYVTEYIEDVNSTYNSSDIIIARCGALTISELAIIAENHQLENAKKIEEINACICVEEKDLDIIFKNKLDLLLKDQKLRNELSNNISQIAMPNASNDIVKLIKKHLSND